MRVAILHQTVNANGPELEQDVLVQVDMVRESLQRMGHEVVVEPCSLNLEHLVEFLRTWRPDVVFNLVESLGGTDAFIHLVPTVLDSVHVPYTGSPTLAIGSTNNKVQAKLLFAIAALPTPAWYCLDAPLDETLAFPDRYIIKPVSEHGSLGMDDHSVVMVERLEDLEDQVAGREDMLERACFAERYIEGREFNLSLLAGRDGPRVLPPAEIEFTDWPCDKPRIVGYSAKWHGDAPEFQGTPRRFKFPKRDERLLRKLSKLAARCWEIFDLRGYARVDFRVDERNRPWIVDVNVNPCLSPDAGFAAALTHAEIPFDEAVTRILEDAVGVFQPQPLTTVH